MDENLDKIIRPSKNQRDSISDMMKHYLDVKDEYENCIVFYRLGDFYEMFFDDAIEVSRLLDLTLTSRACGEGQRAPMCGIPFHSADTYISLLVGHGKKVAICEQLTEPKSGELVQRDVVRIVTAGTVTNDELIDERSNNFIASVYENKNGAAISWADITTGEFFCKNVSGVNVNKEVVNVLIKISPSEIIANNYAIENLKNNNLVSQGVLPRFESFTESEFDKNIALDTLKNQLKVLNLSCFGIKDDDFCISSCGALVSYLRETQKNVLLNINAIVPLNEGDSLMLDANAIRSLELTKTYRDNKKYGSLLWLLDKTKTCMGARKLHNMILSPLYDADKINYRLDGVESFYNNSIVRQSITETLCYVKDIGRISGKISNGNIRQQDCIALQRSLELLPNVRFQLLGIESQIVQDLVSNIADFTDLKELLQNAIYDAFEDKKENVNTEKSKKGSFKYIKSGFNQELDELRDLQINGKAKLLQLELDEREKTGIKTLKVGYNRVFGYYIEVTNSLLEKVPYRYIRKQTLTNGERYVTEELKTLEENLLNAEIKAEELEITLFNNVKNVLSLRIRDLQNTAEAIAELDVLVALANVAREHSYVKPTILDSSGRLNIVEGRHPVVEATSRNRFVPNDCVLDNDENRTMIITGPNMAGKSTYMRQIALITIMAHIGSFVPAKSAEIPLTDRIFTRIGASDSLVSDQSTFMVEMSETAEITKNATQNSLIILDEIGRGTSTFDGLSIAWAVVEYVTSSIKAKTLFATHYHELSELEGILAGVKNYKVLVKELPDKISFLRMVARGSANKSFGIEVAKLAGISAEITTRAKQILKGLEKNDIAKGNGLEEISNNDYNEPSLSNVERILKDIDVNNLSPMQAFNLLVDLCEKVNGKE